METQAGIRAWCGEWDWPAIERFSTQVFGCAHRLSVLLLAADASPSRLYIQAIANCIGLSGASADEEGKTIESFTRRQLASLQAATLLKDNETPPDRPEGVSGRTPTTYLARTEDEFWICLQELGTRFRRAPPRRPRRSGE